MKKLRNEELTYDEKILSKSEVRTFEWIAISVWIFFIDFVSWFAQFSHKFLTLIAKIQIQEISIEPNEDILQNFESIRNTMK